LSTSFINPDNHCLPSAFDVVMIFSKISRKCLSSSWHHAITKRSKLSLTPSFRSRFSARCRVHHRWCIGGYPSICSHTTLSMPRAYQIWHPPPYQAQPHVSGQASRTITSCHCSFQQKQRPKEPTYCLHHLIWL
jgi:hypothetical protein